MFGRLQVKEEEKLHTIMGGDRKHDILGTKACGSHSKGAEFGYVEENELKLDGADYIVSTVEKLKTHIAR